MNKKYDESKESVFIEYLDTNNLYGWAMSKYLPYGGFKWRNTITDILNIPDDSPKGYIMEADLSYPEKLHDFHSDLPLAPENKIGNEKLSKLLFYTIRKNTLSIIQLLNYV